MSAILIMHAGVIPQSRTVSHKPVRLIDSGEIPAQDYLIKGKAASCGATENLSSGDAIMRQSKYLDNFLTATIPATILVTLVSITPAHAAEMTHGEMAAAIRSANYPCAHVKALESAGAEAWSVQCNSGKFRVSRDSDGNFTVTQTE